MNLIYIHGFASSGESTKPINIKEKYPDVTVHSPDLPVAPRQAVNYLQAIIEKNKVNRLVGTSLGGFYAFYLAVKNHIKCLMINPVLDPSVQLEHHLGINKNLVTGEKFQWKREYLDQLAEMEEAIDQSDKRWDDYYLAIGKNDEILDPNKAINYFLYKSTVKIYEEDHRFWKTFSEMIVDKEFQAFFESRDENV